MSDEYEDKTKTSKISQLNFPNPINHMIKRIGYVAISLKIDASTNRTCRLSNATEERLRNLIIQNIDGLKQIIKYNIENNILLYRISSQIIPFASHDINKIEWWKELLPQLTQIGNMIRNSNMRVSMHPSQFVNINSPLNDVVDSSIRDLKWHAKFLDSLGVDNKNKIIIHGGGVYGDKTSSIDRFVSKYLELPKNIQDRLVIENDEKCYTIEDCMTIHKRTNIPIVFDYLHHNINPGNISNFREALELAMSTWKKSDGTPKIHFSSQAKNKRIGSHSETIYIDEFMEFYELTRDLIFDIMLEVKDKDLSIYKIREILNE